MAPRSNTLLSEGGTSAEAPLVAARTAAVAELCAFLKTKKKSVLSAWLHHVDRKNDQMVLSHDFNVAMAELGFPGDAKRLFNDIDADGSKEISLFEVCADDAHLWQEFRQWCVRMFTSKTEMCKVLAGRSQRFSFNRAEFAQSALQHGWQAGEEEKLFDALDVDASGVVEVENLAWLDVEIRRQRRKDDAKRLAMHCQRPDANSRSRGAMLLVHFKRFLVRKYGGYVQAWRNGLCQDGIQHLQRSRFFKACADMGWQKDVRLLWKAFDKDESGYIVIDELDLSSAELLARFHKFIKETFGTTAVAFKAMDSKGRRKVKFEEFSECLQSHGVQMPAKTLFAGIDRYSSGYLVEEDMQFLDNWRPLPFLLANPNRVAMKEFKKLLYKTYRSYLRGWRKVLDPDNTNRCNWDEFQHACKRIGFRGDVAGAWRALDEDLNGEVSLAEIDPYSSDRLVSFRAWAAEEFGNVSCAFNVFDDDNSNSISMMEFRSACRIYGFGGDAMSLFRALDVEGNGSLSRKDVGFLDNWEFRDVEAKRGCHRGALPHEMNSSEVIHSMKMLGGYGLNPSQAAVLQGALETNLGKTAFSKPTVPVAPRVLERSTAKLALLRDESVARINAGIQSARNRGAEEQVQPSLQFADDIYGRRPCMSSSARQPKLDGLAAVGLPQSPTEITVATRAVTRDGGSCQSRRDVQMPTLDELLFNPRAASAKAGSAYTSREGFPKRPWSHAVRLPLAGAGRAEDPHMRWTAR